MFFVLFPASPHLFCSFYMFCLFIFSVFVFFNLIRTFCVYVFAHKHDRLMMKKIYGVNIFNFRIQSKLSK